MSSPKGPPIFVADQIVDGKFRIVRQLGQGGMGAVFEAINLGTNRRVALKVIVSAALANAPDVVTRFHREARASGSIDSKHVVQVLDTGVEPTTGDPYMVMDYLAGEDVHDLVRRVGPLPPELVARIGAQACLGLARAHEAGIIHRDIKSANIFLAERDGGEIEVKLLDFGIAKVRADPVAGAEDPHLTTTGSMIGSPLYMSPEQARSLKTLDGRSDLWSLGVVLYEALTGAPPHNDKTTLGDLLIAICIERVPELQARSPWVPAELARAVEHAMEREPNDRYATATEMYEALAALAGSSTSIRKEMLVGVDETRRAEIAPRWRHSTRPDGSPGTPALNPMAQSVAVSSSTPAPSLNASSSTPGAMAAGAFETSDAGRAMAGPPSQRGGPKWAWAMIAIPAVVVIGAGGAYALRDGSRSGARVSPSADPHTSSSLVATGLVASPPPSTSASAEPVAQAAVKTAKVTVTAPPTAKIEVDDAAAVLHDGALEIKGTPGSRHRVRIANGDASQDFEVTVRDDGTAIPATIALASKPTGAGAKPAGAKPAGPAGGPAVRPAAPATEPTIKKDF
ncbi:MAG: protein kinase [Deltaproteobacteria bacterium]|nr:protein kinase [Deltaproteobacteria bacterium]